MEGFQPFNGTILAYWPDGRYATGFLGLRAFHVGPLRGKRALGRRSSDRSPSVWPAGSDDPVPSRPSFSAQAVQILPTQKLLKSSLLENLPVGRKSLFGF
jgi:hypothetical protein